MDFFGIAKDTVDGFLKANVPMLNFIPDPDKVVKDPLGALGDQGNALLNFVVPAVPLGKAALSAFSDEPNVEGAGGAPIIAAALATLRDMLTQCGADRIPDEGAAFQAGADAFRGITDGLSTMDAPDSWEGAAAEAYTFANELQRNRTRDMAELDRRIREALNTEATDNMDTRSVLKDCAQELNAHIAPALALGAHPVAGDAASLSYQAHVVLRIMPRAIWRFQQLTGQAAAHAEEVHAAGSSYHPIRGEYDGRAQQSSGAGLRVSPEDVRTLSRQQQRAATTIDSTKNLTVGVVANVKQTHGIVCEATGDALATAVEARNATIEWVSGESEQMSEGLAAAAEFYERVDEQQGHRLDGEMPPR
ncbi:MAG: type VII secretion target [Mycobacterium sp.]